MDLIGYIDEITSFYVTGWVANRADWRQSLAVGIFLNGVGVGVCRADLFRDNLDTLDKDATGRYAFRFDFADPLSNFSENDVTVKVLDSSFFLIRDIGPLAPIEADPLFGARRPTGPVIVTTTGRTGSTAVMAFLAQHPNVVVAGDKPFEVEMGCYYAYALRTLLAEGDQLRSLRTDAITASESRYQIGFNPYLEESFIGAFKHRQDFTSFMRKRLPQRISAAFREVILDYYELIATGQGVDNPIYFAEKTLPERDARLGIRFMFPRTREILLIRDPRDIICSAVSSNRLHFERVLEDTLAGLERIVDVLNENNPSVLCIKYEDFVMKGFDTAASICGFLGLATQMPDEAKMSGLFSAHGTSTSPLSSIGRWKSDLSVAEKRQCDILAPLIDKLGYVAT